jgi:hypothetical protein
MRVSASIGELSHAARPGQASPATEYVDHWRPAVSQARSLTTPLAWIWFGDGYRRKVRAYAEAVRMCVN